ncbi:MAG: hypothetical protein HW421_3958 [Ignavibacteria bacterium]|nr:hypothetical protein [Ignavibacteria bacterium]
MGIIQRLIGGAVKKAIKEERHKKPLIKQFVSNRQQYKLGSIANKAVNLKKCTIIVLRKYQFLDKSLK